MPILTLYWPSAVRLSSSTEGTVATRYESDLPVYINQHHNLFGMGFLCVVCGGGGGGWCRRRYTKYRSNTWGGDDDYDLIIFFWWCQSGWLTKAQKCKFHVKNKNDMLEKKSI